MQDGVQSQMEPDQTHEDPSWRTATHMLQSTFQQTHTDFNEHSDIDKSQFDHDDNDDNHDNINDGDDHNIDHDKINDGDNDDQDNDHDNMKYKDFFLPYDWIEHHILFVSC